MFFALFDIFLILFPPGYLLIVYLCNFIIEQFYRFLKEYLNCYSAPKKPFLYGILNKSRTFIVP